MNNFDGRKYWRERLARFPGLQGTGTSFHPVAWQQWLYCGKERAYRRLLKKAGLNISGLKVLDFGCGTGYFENFWESLGAARADGLDIVPDVIERLQKEYANRKYICADISNDPSKITTFEIPDLITAIDVLYHIIDDDQLFNILSVLLKILPDRGYFLFSDALKNSRPAPHVHFRGFDFWLDVLGQMRMNFIIKQSVFSINNREIPGINILPGIIGASQHFLDRLFLERLPYITNNWALLFRKTLAND